MPGAWKPRASLVCLVAWPIRNIDLAAGDEGGEEIAAAEAALLRDRKRRGEHRRARMRAAVRLGQAVELEGVGHGAIGERRRAGMHRRAAGAENIGSRPAAPFAAHRR